MCGIHETIVRQREQLVFDGVIQLPGRSLLEVSPAAASDQQGIPGENYRFIIHNKADTAVGMTGRGNNAKGEVPE